MTFSSSVLSRSVWNLCLISLQTVAIFSAAGWSSPSAPSRSVSDRAAPSPEFSVVSDTASLSVTSSASEREEGCLCLQQGEVRRFSKERAIH